jgi:hypothetical protein
MPLRALYVARKVNSRLAGSPAAGPRPSRRAPTLARPLVSSASKATSPKPAEANRPDLRCQVRRAAVPGPDHRRARTAQGRRRVDGALDVAIAHIAEDAAQQQHVGRQHVREAGHQARICLTDPGPGQALHRSRAAGQDDVTRIGLNQHSTDIIAAGMIRQDTEHVVPLPGAQAHQHDPARRRPVNRIGQVRPDASQPRAQRRRRIIVSRVPGQPVLHPSIVAPAVPVPPPQTGGPAGTGHHHPPGSPHNPSAMIAGAGCSGSCLELTHADERARHRRTAGGRPRGAAAEKLIS